MKLPTAELRGIYHKRLKTPDIKLIPYFISRSLNNSIINYIHIFKLYPTQMKIAKNFITHDIKYEIVKVHINPEANIK